MKTDIFVVVILLLLGYSCAERSTESSAEISNDGHGLSRDKSVITAVVDDYIDKFFANFHNFAIKNGLDPIPLKDFSEKILTEHVTLTHGLLHGISTLKRLESVKLSYSHNKRILTVQAPVVFSNLSFTYDYEVRLVLAKHTGGMTGLIKDFRMDISLQFDFKTYQAALLKSSVLKTGWITLIFDKKITHVLLNILTNFVALILKPFLVLVIQGIVAAAGGKTVDTLNQVIHQILHPNATQVAQVV